MSINNIGPEEIARRKSVSDAKSDTEELTFNNNKEVTNFATDVRNKRDNIELANLSIATDESELEAYLKTL